MKDIQNKTLRHLTDEEFDSLIAAARLIGKGFKKKVHSVFVNADVKNADDVFSIAITFDKYEVEK